MIRALALSLAAVVACGPGPVHPTVANEAPRPTYKTLAERLTAEVGAGLPVAIVGGARGIRAISADGARQVTLATAPVRWVLVDARSNVIWSGGPDGTDYRAIDLDQAPSDQPTVTVVATGLPSPNAVEMVGPAYFGIAYPTPGDPIGMSAEMPDVATGGCCANATITLLVQAEPVVIGSSGYQQDADWSAGFGKAAFPAKAFVVALVARPDHRTKRSVPSEPAGKIDGVDPANCMEATMCGTSEPLAGTHYARVIVNQAFGDVGHITHRLYDTAAKHFVDGDWATWVQNAFVAPDGSGFIHDGRLVRFDRGPLAVTPETGVAYGGGWLGGSEFFGF